MSSNVRVCVSVRACDCCLCAVCPFLVDWYRRVVNSILFSFQLNVTATERAKAMDDQTENKMASTEMKTNVSDYFETEFHSTLNGRTVESTKATTTKGEEKITERNTSYARIIEFSLYRLNAARRAQVKCLRLYVFYSIRTRSNQISISWNHLSE